MEKNYKWRGAKQLLGRGTKIRIADVVRGG